MSTVSQHIRYRVQRLRDKGETSPLPSGSLGFVPGELCHLLPSCCSNPRRTGISPDQGLAAIVRLCECEADRTAVVKSSGHHGSVQHLAKIAAFHDQALSRIQYLLESTACWLEARMGTFPPSSLIHGPP
jgi:hypothetical protein